VDYQEEGMEGPNAPTNVDGQPKSLVPIVRDYSTRTRQDPWELRFRFKVSQAGPGELIDISSSSTWMEQSTAIASALTYYHRGSSTGKGAGHSREPPNFLNPFWRATLVSSDVDEPYGKRGDDVIRTLEGLGEGQKADALRRLRASGFEAIP
jgi:hypothetical protein